VVNQALISVVDDDDCVRESLRGLLRSMGFRVGAFASAEEFLNSDDLLHASCLIVDVRMPGMGGLELHRHLAVSGPAIPVVFITAHGSEHSGRGRALSEGAVEYLIKPFSEEALVQAVNAALSLTMRDERGRP
jgi:FixJ family two-component response regulator